MCLLNKEWLIEKIKDLGKENILFYNEAQFQFRLAWEIQKAFEQYEVILECLTIDNKRSYTDIMVKLSDNNYVAIELKYKTKCAKNKSSNNEEESGYILKHHGAVDFGRFDYLWDINRLEMLVYKSKKIESENKIKLSSNQYRDAENKFIENKYKILKPYDNAKIIGYAIILTNDELYWRMSKRESIKENESVKTCRKGVQYQDFCIAEGDIAKGELNWKTNSQKKYYDAVRKTWRGRKIKLLQEYAFKWNKYESKHHEFKFCISEIKSHDPI